MPEHALTITYVPDQDTIADQDRRWLTISRVETDDTITLTDAAVLVDSIYSIMPCEQEGPGSGGTAAQDPPAEDFAATIQQKADLNICSIDDSGTYTETLKIVRSHLYEPYSLKLSRGTAAGAKIVEKEVEYDINIRNQSSVVLDYPFSPCPDPDDPAADPVKIDVEWLGSVYDELNQIIEPPGISKTCSTLNFGTVITATIRVKYIAQYDLVDVTVPGVGNQAVMSTARCFYLGLIVKHDIEPPDTDDDTTILDRLTYCADTPPGTGGTVTPNGSGTPQCYELVNKSWLCECSGDEDHSAEVEQDVTCPDDITCPDSDDCRHFMGSRSETADYVNCGESDEISTVEFYEATCCHSPPDGAPPHCRVKYSKNNGGAGIKYGAQYYRDHYGQNVQLIAVSPKDGDCGTLKTEQIILPNSCCDGVEALSWDAVNSADIITTNDTAEVYVLGGRDPRTWKLRGSGFWVDAACTQREVTKNGSSLTIYTDATACGSCAITASDGCSDIGGTIRSTAGQWVEIPVGDAPMIPADTYNDSADAGECGRAWAYLSGTNGKYKVAQRLLSVNGGGDSGSSYADCYSACVGVDADWTVFKDQGLADNADLPLGEPMLIDRERSGTVLPATSDVLYQSNYNAAYADGYGVIEDDGRGYNLYCDNADSPKICETGAWILAYRATGFPECTTMPQAWEWRC